MDMLSFITQPLHLIISLYTWIVIIGAVLSFLPIDRNHPLVEIINRLTEPAFNFIRQKMPWVVISGMDLAPLVLLVLLHFVDALLVFGPVIALVQAMQTVIFSYMILIIISAVLSFVQVDPYNPIVSSIRRLTEPTFQFVRQKLPFLVMGGIDLSPVAIIIGLNLLNTLLAKVMIGL